MALTIAPDKGCQCGKWQFNSLSNSASPKNHCCTYHCGIVFMCGNVCYSEGRIALLHYSRPIALYEGLDSHLPMHQYPLPTATLKKKNTREGF